MEDIGLDKLISDAFTEETEAYLNSLNLYELFETLRLIKNKIEQNIDAHLSLLVKTSKSYNLRSDRNNESEIIKTEKLLLFEAYEIIQIIRERLTGQKLDYRLYITTDGKDGVPATAEYIDVANAVDLFQFISLNSKEISIAASKVQAEITKIKNKNPNYYSGWFENKYATVLQHFRHPKDGEGKQTFFVLKIPTVFPPPQPRKKPHSNQNVVYTRGHIIEALDSVYRSKYSPLLEEQASDSLFIKFFGEELGYDNVSGFKGGDNEMTQIKANAARLMRYTSIMNAINKVLVIYDLIANPGSKGILMDEVSKKIKTFYSNSRAKNEISKVSDKMIDQFVEQLLLNLTEAKKYDIIK